MTPAAAVRHLPAHVTAGLYAPLCAALAVLVAIPWWPWEDRLLHLRVFLAVVYGLCAIVALIVAAREKRRTS